MRKNGKRGKREIGGSLVSGQSVMLQFRIEGLKVKIELDTVESDTVL